MNARRTEISQALARVEDRIVNAATAAGRLRSEIKLIVVTKTFPITDLEICYELGLREFGENRDQEGAPKAGELPTDINWHFQGQIQGNKIKSIATWADVVHSIDNFSHASKLSLITTEQGLKSKEVFIQVSLDSHSDEANPGRGGVSPSELAALAEQILELPSLELVGLMAVAPLAQDPDLAFQKLRQISTEIQNDFPSINRISAGMSNDFESAILHGATHIRIGSQILGLR
jgi:pyridoxal phosphate enzyme (YggS family)